MVWGVICALPRCQDQVCAGGWGSSGGGRGARRGYGGALFPPTPAPTTTCRLVRCLGLGQRSIVGIQVGVLALAHAAGLCSGQVRGGVEKGALGAGPVRGEVLWHGGRGSGSGRGRGGGSGVLLGRARGGGSGGGGGPRLCCQLCSICSCSQARALHVCCRSIVGEARHHCAALLRVQRGQQGGHGARAGGVEGVCRGRASKGSGGGEGGG